MAVADQTCLLLGETRSAINGCCIPNEAVSPHLTPTATACTSGVQKQGRRIGAEATVAVAVLGPLTVVVNP